MIAVTGQIFRVARLVLQQSGMMVLCGVVPGIACALVAEHLLRSFLFGVKALDPVSITMSGAILTRLPRSPQWNRHGGR